MERTLNICGQDVKFKATASTTRRYRQKFQRDMFADMADLMQSAENGQLTATALETFENVAYIMAKQGDESIPDNPDEWLDSFDMMSIYDVLPELISLWGLNEETLETPKKKVGEQSGR